MLLCYDVWVWHVTLFVTITAGGEYLSRVHNLHDGKVDIGSEVNLPTN